MAKLSSVNKNNRRIKFQKIFRQKKKIKKNYNG